MNLSNKEPNKESSIKLTNKTVKNVAENSAANGSKIITPQYDRENTEIGIVHLGPGAFHRAHQAE